MASPSSTNLLRELDDRSSPLHRWALVAIILAGFLLRFYALFAGQGYRYFGIQDEVYAFSKVLRYFAGEAGVLATGQPIIAGIFIPGAAWPLFCLMLVKLGGGTMTGALVLITLLTSAAIFLVYRLALHFTSPRGALFSALLFAVSPWTVYYSFGMWNPVPMVLWGAVLFLSLWNTMTRDRSRYIFWVCLMSAIMPQFHMITVFYWPAVLLLLYLGPARIHRGWMTLGVIAGIAFYVPYLAQELANQGENTRLILTGEKPHSLGVFRLLSAPVTVLSNVPSRWFVGGTAELKAFARTYFGSYIVLGLVSAASTVNAVAFFVVYFRDLARAMRGRWRSVREDARTNPERLFIAVLLVVPSLFFLLTRHSFNSRYTIVIFPLLFLLPPLFLASITRPAVKRFFAVNIAVMLVANVFLILAFYHYQSVQLRRGDVFQPSFANMQAAVDALRADAGPDRRVVLDVSGFYAAATPAPGQPWYIAAHSFATYVNAFAATHPNRAREEPAIVYTMHLATDRVLDRDRIVFQKNGMALVRRGER